MKIELAYITASLERWITDIGIDRFEYNFSTGELSFLYEEDFLAYKLAFPEHSTFLAGFNGITSEDLGVYYAPYIPVSK